jgi:ATP-dependent RNA helicase DDX31/DBP7
VTSVEDVTATKRYFERCVSIINSLVLKMIVTVMKNGEAGMEISVDPRFITAENLEVNHSIDNGETLDFIHIEDHDQQQEHLDDTNWKYGAMKALGKVTYELLMRGDGPPIMAFLPSTITNSEGSAELLLNLDDCPNQSGSSEQVKRPRASDRNQGRLSSAMISTGVPYPLCRLVIDLLGGECSDGLLFRSDNSFESFPDVLADLKQMMDNPEAFIHLSVKDQWRLAFGHKMHGRETEKGMIMEVASRITGAASNDPLAEALAMIQQNKPKQQVIMVKGKPGSGKSRLVTETRKMLENLSFLFLSCKFDRIVHSEPLAVMAGAFDEFLIQCIGNSRQHRIQTSLKQLIQPEDISILMKHIPSLIHYTEIPLEPTSDFQVNKEQIHQLFSKLIDVLSEVGPPVFFIDDLQWADTASVGLFLSLITRVKLTSEGCNKDMKSRILFIGSYRDNELDGNPQLVEMFERLRTIQSIELTEIGVGGFDGCTLNGIVSESLCLPLRRTKSLTEIILQKTDGIIIHIIEFIGRLTMERILCHSFVKGWEWDSKVIESCPISESVAELFTFKLRSLSNDALFGVQICSIFGIQIDKRVTTLIQGYDGDNSVDINAGIEAAIELGVIETDGFSTFKFAHDLIVQVITSCLHNA